MQNYHTFDFNIPDEFLITKLDVPAYITVDYDITDNKVEVFNYKMRPTILDLLKDKASLRDIIYRAAENNAVNLDLFKPKTTVDFMAQIFDHFKLPNHATNI